jgi:hypothetical protein
LGHNCDNWDDGCGTILSCGTCSDGQTCIEGSCQAVPVLNLEAQSGGSFTLGWTYQWSGLASTSDHYSLEESTISSSSGFSEILQTTWNDRTSPWFEDLNRSTGTYYYRVRAYSATGWSEYSNVVTVTVLLQPPVLRIVNDLYDQVAGPNNWPQMNQIFRVWIADDEAALNNCNDSCDRLYTGTCELPGEVIVPDMDGSSYLDFDVSMYVDGGYWVYFDCGWWDYFCPSTCCWEEHATAVMCCDGVNTCWKWATFWVSDHFDGVMTVNASQFLPIGNWTDSQFCN